MHLPTVNVRFNRHELKPKWDETTWKMRIKRALVFAVTLTVLGSVYYFYSLHFKPNDMSEEAWENNELPDDKRIVVDTKPKNPDPKRQPSTKTFQLFRHHDDEDDDKNRDRNRFDDFDDIGDDVQSDFADFDDGDHLESTESAEDTFGGSRGTDGDFDDKKGYSPTHATGDIADTASEVRPGGDVDDKGQLALEQRLEEQQELIKQQAQILQQLQAKLLGNNQYDYQQQQRQPLPQPFPAPQPQHLQPQQLQPQQLHPQELQPQPLQPQQLRPQLQNQGPAYNNLAKDSKTQAAIDRNKNFRGQIKGNFHGTIMDPTQNKEQTYPDRNRLRPQGDPVPPSPVHRDPQGGWVGDSTFGRKTVVDTRGRQSISSAEGKQADVVQDRQPVDAAQMFADARNKALPLPIPANSRSHNERTSQTEKNSDEAGDGKTEVVDAEKLFEEARLKGLRISDVAQQARRQQGTRAGNVFGVPDRRTGRRDIEEQEQNEGAQDNYRESQDQFGQTEVGAATDDEKLEEALEQVGDDPLLKDHINMVKDKLEDFAAGEEPEVDTENELRGSDSKSLMHVNVYDLTQTPTGPFQCVPLRLSVMSRTICVHSHGRDSEQSEHLIMSGKWEEQELDFIRQTLRADRTLGLLDLGAGLGVYTVAAVAEGRLVLAVEPLKENIRLFHKTVQLNSGTNRVTLITDALGERPGVGRLLYPHPVGNMGAVYVKPLKLTEVGGDVTDLVQIVRLDDLIPMTPFPRAVMKLDVQGDENLVLKGAHMFFQRVDVRYVFMHWLPTQNPSVFNEAGALLRQWGYEAAESPTGRALSVSELSNDLNFVVWRKLTDAAESQDAL